MLPALLRCTEVARPMSLMVINGNGALAFDVGFTLNIRHSFDSSARQFQANKRQRAPQQ
jgi:hypothetical protein